MRNSVENWTLKITAPTLNNSALPCSLYLLILLDKFVRLSSGVEKISIIFHRFAVIVVVYLVGGVSYMHFAKGANGSEMIPNVTFWKGVPVLIKVPCYQYKSSAFCN